MTDLKLKIEQWPIGKVFSYARNARLHSDEQVSLVANSIKEFGFVNPCLVDANGVLIAGHCRILASKQLGMKTVPVIKLGHLTEQQARAYRIADNSLPMRASWDNLLMLDELKSLKLENYDIPLLGFTEMDLLKFGISSGTDSDQDPEKVPPLPKKPVVRKGDLWMLGDEKTGHRLLCGDSTNADDVAKAVGGGKPHLLVSDPPYGVDYDPNWRNEEAAKGNLAYADRRIGEVKNDDRNDWREAWALFTGDGVCGKFG